MKLTPQDLFAGLVALILACGLVGLALQSKDIPTELATPFTMSMTWLFVRGAQLKQNGGYKG